MHPMLNTAVKAARRAGGIINRASQNLDLLHVSRKAHSDFVSEVDSNAEEAIIKVLLETYPKHSILAEESGATGDQDEPCLLYTSPSPRDRQKSRMPSSA